VQFDAPADAAAVDPAVFAAPGGWATATAAWQQARHSVLLAEDVTAWSAAADADGPAAETITLEVTVRQGSVARETTFGATLRSRDTDVAAAILAARQEQEQ
jgi:hypothetical protein